MRKTKIICTLGPSTDKGDVLETLIKEGMDVARFNFSHGPHDEQRTRIQKLRKLREKYNRPVAALLDTKGPEIRLKTFENESVVLEKGQEFTLGVGDFAGNQKKVAITYEKLYEDVKKGDNILIDDGLIGMVVERVEGTDIVCKVINGGKVSNKKGINVPGVVINIPFISQKDYEDILFGIEEEFDFIAASFTRTPDDVYMVRKILEENGGEKIKIIAKIENQQGVDNIDAIIEAADGIMVARGDMGVEIPLEEVPIIQKMIIQKVFHAGKQVITATQMLDSMIKNPRPTRAETTDVANAIYQGTSAIMLSGETAAGMYPVEALKTMVKIASRTEKDIDYKRIFTARPREEKPDMTAAISHACCMTAIELDARAIITVSKTGRTARNISKYRPNCMVVDCSTDEHVCRQLNMSWGVYPILIHEEYSMEILFLHAVEAAQRHGFVDEGDVVVLTAGVPLGKPGNTNIIKTSIVGEY